MTFLERMKVSHRLAILAAIAILGVLLIILEAVRSADEMLLLERKLKTRHLVEVAHGVLSHWQAREASGEINKDEAQAQALRQLKALRYEKKEYFWVNDMQPAMLMHPIKPELDGKNLADFKDPQGTRIFVKFVETVKKDGAGFVFYLWPKPAHDKPVPKISYVQGFAPWGWIVGSGIYADEADNLFWGQAVKSIALAGVVGLVLLVAAGLIGGSITRQLGAEPSYATYIARRVAAGDLTGTVNLRRGDETSVLHAMVVMQENLTAIVRLIQDNARRIAEAVSRLVTVSDSVRGASEQQSAAASATASAVNQITASIGRVSDNANQTESESLETTELSKSGERLAMQAAEGITAVAQTVDMATRQIQSLKGRLREIGNFSKVIKDIADQTNLLALNAAIEAARAGEQGRGFAVVADEVRKLAERASNATAQIAEVIRAVEDDTQTTVGSIEAIVPRVSRGAEMSGEAARSLNRINSGTEQTLLRVRQVAQAMTELRQNSNDITDNVAQIADMVEKNSVSIRGSANISEELRELAGSLGEAVAKFRVSA